MKKILISTGGSGGHVIPAITFYEHVNKQYKLKIVTDVRGSRFFDERKYKYTILDVPNPKKSLIKFFLSFFSAFIYLKKNNIDILFSTGGYMSLPFCVASLFLKIKIILYEPNKVLGRTNKSILRFSNRIICYHETLINCPDKHKNKIFRINPLLRKEIYNFKKNSKVNINKRIKLLVLGGSQGAEIFDKAIIKIINEISKFYKINLTQQIFDKKNIEVLKKKYADLNIEYHLFDFNHDLFKKYEEADIVITRCGASTLSEISFFNIPFVAIPFPFAKDNHQYFNAKYFSEKNCCWLFEQNEKLVQNIVDLFKSISNDDQDYRNKQINLENISYQNNWNNINKNLIDLLNEY